MAESIALGMRLSTATELASAKGIEGEISVVEGEWRAVVHDGVTNGGYPVAKKSEVDGAIQTANSANSTASAAQTAANEAKNTASSAVTTANGAVTTANTAKTTAEGAVKTANTASTNASSAKTSAESAVSTANTAKSTADTAKSTADSALSVANSAVKKVNGQTPNASGEVTISSVTNATNATKATQDASGNVITSTYATKTSVTSVQTTAESALSKANAAVKKVNGVAPGTDGNVEIEIPSSVHVGASAPTDSDTSVWIDTDENVTLEVVSNDDIIEAANRVTDVETNPSVATVEALQTAIARIESNMLEGSDSATIVGWVMPNYAAGVSYTFGNAVPSDGWMYIWNQANQAGADMLIAVNGVQVVDFNNLYGKSRNSAFIPVSKGDTVTVVSSAYATEYANFFPCKGA